VSPDGVGPRGSSTEWSKWGTYVHLAVGEPHLLPRAFAMTTALLEAVDRACSRFRGDSDLVRVNRTPGRWVRVDPLLTQAISVALRAAELTDGLVNPCLGRALVALGYDADLGVVRRRKVAPARRLPLPAPQAWRGVGVAEDAVRVPDGCELDLGATAKAWAADLVAATVAERLGCQVLVSLGGDVRVDGPAIAPWPVLVTERREETRGQLVELSSGGLATSTTTVRRWRGPTGEVHHLLDPRTNRPVDGSLRTVTAAGRSSLAANAASTAALVLGSAAPAWLEEHGVSARLVHVDGTTSRTGSWPAERRVA
jgi:thiamine biosynthesis lipoprotein